MRRQAGEITITDPGSDRPLVTAATVQCVHCGQHWRPMPGSGRVRGFCARCNGPVCGPSCAECIPAEQQLENIEAGRPVLTTRPLIVPVRFRSPSVPGQSPGL